MAEAGSGEGFSLPIKYVDGLDHPIGNPVDRNEKFRSPNRTVTVTNPDGGDRVTEHYLCGRVKSVTGTAVVDQFYTYGVDNGLRWTKVYTGTGDDTAQMWTESYTYDRLGRQNQ